MRPADSGIAASAARPKPYQQNKAASATASAWARRAQRSRAATRSLSMRAAMTAANGRLQPVLVQRVREGRTFIDAYLLAVVLLLAAGRTIRNRHLAVLAAVILLALVLAARRRILFE